jgi:hypothetical protein
LKLICIVEAKASDILMPCSGAYGPLHVVIPMLGLKNSVR